MSNQLFGFIVRMALLCMILSLIFGCATPLTEGEREYRLGETRLAHAACRKAYHEAGVAWVIVATHIRSERRPLSLLELRSDLHTNQCWEVVRAYGFDI